MLSGSSDLSAVESESKIQQEWREEGLAGNMSRGMRDEAKAVSFLSLVPGGACLRSVSSVSPSHAQIHVCIHIRI